MNTVVKVCALPLHGQFYNKSDRNLLSSSFCQLASFLLPFSENSRMEYHKGEKRENFPINFFINFSIIQYTQVFKRFFECKLPPEFRLLGLTPL